MATVKWHIQNSKNKFHHLTCHGYITQFLCLTYMLALVAYMILLELNSSVTRMGRSKFYVEAKRLLVWWHNSLIKVEIYVFVKYRSFRSNQGLDTTTSVSKNKGVPKLTYLTCTSNVLACRTPASVVEHFGTSDQDSVQLTVFMSQLRWSWTDLHHTCI